ncbi:MAG: glycine zipper 2TM domain-containing protein [Polymorphobacter sp.]|uniref:glycine zipper 2TM domain-containing protein n=1 Tax=Polymorphobacter sp. TaxID=1909290 RepID=UPI003A87614E
MSAKFILAALTASLAATAIPTTAVQAGDWDDDRYERRWDDRRWNADWDDRRDDRRWNNRDQRRWNGNGNRCYDEGKGGTVIGAIGGGVLGNTVAGRGDKLLGTIIGGGLGALAGRAIDKSDGRDCNWRR